MDHPDFGISRLSVTTVFTVPYSDLDDGTEFEITGVVFTLLTAYC